MTRSSSFLDLLYAEAPREAYDKVVAQAEAEGLSEAELEQLREQMRVALRLREQFVRQRQREAEMSALFRKFGHSNYRTCGDQFLRNFLKGLTLRVRG